MKYRYLGSSGLLVSRITLGTMTFGVADWGCDEQESHAIIKQYLDAGGNFLDGADGMKISVSRLLWPAIIKRRHANNLITGYLKNAISPGRCWPGSMETLKPIGERALFLN